MKNHFFSEITDDLEIADRIRELENGKVGFYSVGLYPASLAYNCAMQTSGANLLLAPRPDRELLGAFPEHIIQGMDKKHISTMNNMGSHLEGHDIVSNNLSDLILRCELVILSSNSNHIQEDLILAKKLREDLNRKNVVLACLAGSFCHNSNSNLSFVLCEKEHDLGFFSGFHRHGALRNPLDSFTANFCHPNAVTAMFGARMLDRLSPNIQVSAGVHNVEGQYIKAAKNMSSIFAGFGHHYHQNNPGVLPTILTLLLEQCLDQAATVAMCRKDRLDLYNKQPFSLTELGYGVQRIEAALVKDGDMQKVRDHTFSQLTAMVADVRGSMMQPVSGEPTRNFQAGRILSSNMNKFKRCPNNLEEFISWCEGSGLKKGGLEGLKSLEYWPQIIHTYSIPIHDSSLVNLLYMSIFGDLEVKQLAYIVLTDSRQLTNYCQESVRPTHSRRYTDALNNIHNNESMELLIGAVKYKNSNSRYNNYVNSDDFIIKEESPIYLRLMELIERFFNYNI